MNISANLASIGANQTFLNTVASNISNVNTKSFVPKSTVVSNNLSTNTRLSSDNGSKTSQTDLAKEIPNLIVSQDVNAVNISAIKTQDEMTGTLLDTKA